MIYKEGGYTAQAYPWSKRSTSPEEAMTVKSANQSGEKSNRVGWSSLYALGVTVVESERLGQVVLY